MIVSCLLETIAVLSTLFLQVKTAQHEKFVWDRSDRFYDCIVGISLNDRPSGVGVLISSWYFLTSANALHTNAKMKIYAIDGAWDIPHELTKRDRYIKNRDNEWVKVGLNHTHTTIHDLALITLNVPHRHIKNSTSGGYGRPYFVKTVKENPPYKPHGWKFAGFGFVDKNHVNKGVELQVVDHGLEGVLEDCDEWIPRAWGRFICLSNINNYAGIQSGAPLFNDDRLYGLGAFEVTKGNESILVFTELKPYFDVGPPYTEPPYR